MRSTPPILLLIYNRPSLTRKILSRVREMAPPILFVAADGPQEGDQVNIQLCMETRSVVEQIDWPCELHTLFRDRNLGCKKAVSDAISWFFSQVDAGIILEDDCLPTVDFFYFCNILLEKYHNDERIGMISGNNFGFDLYDNALSYSFSKHGHIWGWATWKRCWDKFDANLGFLNETNIDLIKTNISDNSEFVEKWWQNVDTVIKGNLDTWDAQWGVTRYANNYLTIRPKVNLVANIGFGDDATHTKGKSPDVYTLTGDLEFPLVHPKNVVPDRMADKKLEQFFLSAFPRKITHVSQIVKRIKNRIVRLFFN